MEKLLNGFEVFGSMTQVGKVNGPEYTQEDPNKELIDEKPIKLNEQQEQEDGANEDLLALLNQLKEEVEDKNKEEESNEEEDFTPYEALFDVMNQQLGVQLGDDVQKPKSPEDLAKYFQTLIKESSKPDYASEELYKLDQFIREGGDLKKYLSIDSEISYEATDIEENEEAQKDILKKFLKEKGYSSDVIDKKIQKYDEAGLLQDEATDALDFLKQSSAQKKQQLLVELENQAKLEQQRNEQYFNDVYTELKSLNDIRGVKIPEQDKAVLLDYIFKPEADGQTKFSKDWSSNVKNLLETAYFTMKGDSIIRSAKSEGSNSAIARLKESLNKQGISRRTNGGNTAEEDSLWNSFAKKLRS